VAILPVLQRLDSLLTFYTSFFVCSSRFSVLLYECGITLSILSLETVFISL